MRRKLVQMLMLVFLGSAVGLAYNAVSPKGIPLKGGSESRLAQKGARMMDLEEVRFYLEQPGTLMVDARSPEEFALGHIPGSLNLPADEYEAAYPKVAAKLKAAKLLIVYCSGGSCGTSEEVALKLLEGGYKENSVAIFADGLPGWMRAKLPIQQGETGS
jgi:rhodanese-related sulfurtransferase